MAVRGSDGEKGCQVGPISRVMTRWMGERKVQRGKDGRSRGTERGGWGRDKRKRPIHFSFFIFYFFYFLLKKLWKFFYDLSDGIIYIPIQIYFRLYGMVFHLK